MPFYVSNTFADGEVISATEINENFSDIEGLVNGGLTNENISASANIALTKLANRYTLIPVTFQIDAQKLAAAAASATVPYAAVPIPGFNDSYSVAAISWNCSDIGTQTTVIRLNWGAYTGASNAWVTVTNLCASTTLNGGTNNQPFQGSITVTGSTITQSASVERAIGLFITTLDASMCSAAIDTLNVTVWLKHLVTTL